MSSNEPSEKRTEFLIEMYKQMMADINRHIMVVWQSIGVVIGSFAIFGLVEKRILSVDYASSLLLIICAWACALLIDSNYWYNRNLCIIANIERQFLRQTDLRDVHYYFGKHRPGNGMITTLKIQMGLCFGVSALVIVYHFAVQVIPGLMLSFSDFDPPRALPYAVTLIAGCFLLKLLKKRKNDYEEFLRNSPGSEINTTGVEYGGGHGFGSGGG